MCIRDSSKPAQTVMSALGIYREAVKLVAMPEDPLRYSIEFAYSADYDCRVTAYWPVSYTHLTLPTSDLV